jgi:cell division topological specificity factor
MSLAGFFSRRGSAAVARDRLQILLAHERSTSGRADLVGILREEILDVIGRHVPIETDKVHVKMNPGRSVSTLEIGIEIPTQATSRTRAA